MYMIQVWALFLLGLAVLSGCAAHERDAIERVPGGETTAAGGGTSLKFYHAVFFTCRPGTPDSEIDALVADAYGILARVPSVRSIHSGRRDPRMMRDVNDKDFTVGLLVVFDDKAGHDLYNDHVLHKQYVDKHKDAWASVRVYDFQAK